MPTPLQALQKHFGLDSFRPAQHEIINNLLEGKNTLATLPTGAGKSLTFQLPAFLLPGSVLVISPLLSLIRDQVQKLNTNGIRAAQIDSTLTPDERQHNLTAIANGEVKIIYTSPETLSQPQIHRLLKSIRISLVAIDEVHCYSEWGHSFRPSYLSLPHLSRALKPHAILCLTATATKKVASDIRKAFRIKVCDHISQPIRRNNLRYSVIPCQHLQRFSQLIDILQRPDHLPAIVYVMKQEQCEELSAYISKRTHHPTRAYHAGMSTADRKKVQDAFIAGSIEIIVATIAFGMGVDKSNIRSIIHFHLPKSPEGWLQESGRAGRDGKLAFTYLLACGDDVIPLTNFIRCRELTERTLSRLITTLTSQGKNIVIQPYQLKIQLEVLTSTLDVLLAKLELLNLIKYSHTSWRFVKMNTNFGRNFNLLDYPKSHRPALQAILNNNHRYDLHDCRADFGIAPEKLYQTLQDIKLSGECRLQFSGWQKHYILRKPADQIDIPALTHQLNSYHQEQLASAQARLDAVQRIATTKTCLPMQLEKWLGIQHPPCGTCSACTEPPSKRKLPHQPLEDLKENDIILIQNCIHSYGKRLNNAQKLTRFLCGIPTPYNRHFFLYKRPEFAAFRHHPYDTILAYAKALMGEI